MTDIKLANGISFPAHEAVTQIFGFIARRGAGKTYAAGVVAEGLLEARHQLVVFDPIGNWYGLRMSASGKRGAYDIPVFGGEHGDVPLTHESGALIADVIVGRGISAVLDVSHFRKAQRKRFVTDFCEQLFHLKKTSRSPVHIVFEESQVFAPQRVSKGEERMLGAVKDVIRLGRNYGIGASLISQRPQSVNKEVLNQVECLVALQTNGSQERKALCEWATANTSTDGKSLDQELPGLAIGHACVWSPQWLRVFKTVKISKKRTYDASSTPGAGADPVEPKPLSDSDLEQLRQSMIDVVEEAEAKDVKKLQRRIRELEARAPETETIEVPIVPESLIEELRDMRDELGSLAEQVDAVLTRVDDARCAKAPLPVKRPPPVRDVKTTTSAPKPVRNGKGSTGSPVRPHLRAGARRMLAALCVRPTLTRQQVATLSGMKVTSGTFSTYMGELKAAGYIVDERGRLSITDVGRSYLDDIGELGSAASTPDEVRQLLLPRFRAGARRMLQAIIDADERGLSRDELAEAAGMEVTSGTFNTYLGELRSNGLVSTDSGVIVADELLL